MLKETYLLFHKNVLSLKFNFRIKVFNELRAMLRKMLFWADSSSVRWASKHISHGFSLNLPYIKLEVIDSHYLYLNGVIILIL